jgi:hypothetical protein
MPLSQASRCLLLSATFLVGCGSSSPKDISSKPAPELVLVTNTTVIRAIPIPCRPSLVIGNADMHLKNWSLLYPDRRRPQLAPGYDFVATLPYIPDDTLGLSFGDSRSLSEITPDQMRRFADTARIPASPLWPIVAETAERTVHAWDGLEEKELLSGDMRGAIGKHILAVAATFRDHPPR